MKILIAGISVRAAVESAVRSGYPVIALDVFGDRDLRLLTESLSLHHDLHSSYSPHALEQASRALSYDAVAYTSNLENHPDTLRRIAGDRQIIGNAPDTIRAVRSWQDLFARLKQAGFVVPETHFGRGLLQVDCRRQWLIKPRLSGGGQGVAFARPQDSPGTWFMLQEFIPGKSCSATFVANGQDCVVLGVTGQLIGNRQFGSKGFRYCGNILPLPEILVPEAGGSILERIHRLAEFLTREYGLIGINGIDFILTGDQVCLIEVNPRYSASMELIEQAHRVPIFQVHAQAVLEGKLPQLRLAPGMQNGNFFGKAILFAEEPAIVPDTGSWLERSIRDVPAEGERLLAGNPICTLFANQPTYEETLTDLARQAASLRREIYG
jgi:uncharacterized protein